MLLKSLVNKKFHDRTLIVFKQEVRAQHQSYICL